MKKLLVKNSLYSIVQVVVSSALVLLAVPVFINTLGSEEYGLFALIMVVGNLNTFTNLGLTNTLVKFVAEQGKTDESNTDIIVNLVLVVLITLPFSIVFIIFNNFILLNILGVSSELLEQVKWLYIFVVSANFFLFVGQNFKAILDALQNVYITSMLQLIYNVIFWGLILVFLLLGWKLFGVGVAVFLSAFIWFIITLVLVKIKWGRISPEKFKDNFKSSAAKQIKYGLKIYSSGLIGFFYEPLTKILVSHFIGIAEVGFYDIVLKLRNQIWSLVSKIYYPLFPFISEQKDKAVIRKYIHAVEQKAFYVVIPLVAIIILATKPFIQLWIGNNVEMISIAAVIIVSFHLIGSTVIPNYHYLMAKDLAEKTILLQLSNVVFNTIFFFITIKYAGFFAIVIANAAAITSSFVLSLYYQKKYLNSLIFDSIKQVGKIILIFIISIAATYMVIYYLQVDDLLRILVAPFIVCVVTVLLYRFLNLVTKSDIDMFLGFNEPMSKIAKMVFIK